MGEGGRRPGGGLIARSYVLVHNGFMSFLGLFKRPGANKGKKDSRPKDDGRHKAEAKPKSTRAKKSVPREPQGLSLDQKLDIAGVGLIIAGGLIVLAFLSPNNSELTAPILKLLGQLFGVGRYLVPVGVILLGVWIVLRHFGDRLPRIEPVRVLGWALLYVVALVSLHFFSAQTTEDARQMAEAGQGGGYIGYGILTAMVQLMGTAGSVFVVIGWWIVALILALGITMQQMITTGQAIMDRLRPPRAGQPELPLRSMPPAR